MDLAKIRRRILYVPRCGNQERRGCMLWDKRVSTPDFLEVVIVGVNIYTLIYHLAHSLMHASNARRLVTLQ